MKRIFIDGKLYPLPKPTWNGHECNWDRFQKELERWKESGITVSDELKLVEGDEYELDKDFRFYCPSCSFVMDEDFYDKCEGSIKNKCKSIAIPIEQSIQVEGKDLRTFLNERWPDVERLRMLEKGRGYTDENLYHFGYYDGYQRLRELVLSLLTEPEKGGLPVNTEPILDDDDMKAWEEIRKEEGKGEPQRESVIETSDGWERSPKMPDYDGNYQCYISYPELCGEVSKYQKVVMCLMNEWKIEKGEEVTHWRKLFAPPNFNEMYVDLLTVKEPEETKQ